MSEFSRGTCDEMRGKGLEKLEVQLRRLKDLETKVAEATKILNEPIPVNMALASDLQCLRFLEGRIAKAKSILTNEVSVNHE